MARPKGSRNRTLARRTPQVSQHDHAACENCFFWQAKRYHPEGFGQCYLALGSDEITGNQKKFGSKTNFIIRNGTELVTRCSHYCTSHRPSDAYERTIRSGLANYNMPSTEQKEYWDMFVMSSEDVQKVIDEQNQIMAEVLGKPCGQEEKEQDLDQLLEEKPEGQE